MESSDILILLGLGFVTAGLYMMSEQYLIFWCLGIGGLSLGVGVLSEVVKIGGGD